MQEAELGLRIPALGDILTFFVRLIFVLAPFVATIVTPIIVSRQKAYKEVKSGFLKAVIIIVSAVGGFIAAAVVIPILLSLITAFEQASGFCVGVSCGIGY